MLSNRIEISFDRCTEGRDRQGPEARTGLVNSSLRSRNWIDHHSSVSGPTPRLEGVILIVSYSVTRTTPGAGSSITSMIVSSMTGTPCLGAFLGAIFAAVFRGRFFVVARFAAFLRAGLAVCTENPIRIDWRRESPNVGAQ
jgi:hypothetical protein